ncbi:lipase [Streptomyces pactum]|uniref:Lipase n=1 Tax=Streptomyces pactum TaxID=68249 RepID=A0ABS0NJJ7_9ACTN|nr:lipase [Streptomyces pactum]MBH5335368.1 lipase [Streptomyces pactum]
MSGLSGTTTARRSLTLLAACSLSVAALLGAAPPAPAGPATGAAGPTAASSGPEAGASDPAAGASTGSGAAPAAAGRGTLLSAERILTLTPDGVRSALTANGYPAGSVRYGVDAYRLRYLTVTPRGRTTVASGLVVLPRGAHGTLPTVSYAHGTLVHRDDAPSVQPAGRNAAVPLAFAAAGRAATATDYLGLGLGPGTHPYLDIPSETSAQLDMLRAARTHGRGLGRTLSREVLVTGFSQGAPAAMALGRALQEGRDHGFRLGALAPVSGAYDLTGSELPALLRGELEPRTAVFLAAYALVALDRVHDVYDRPSDVFREPYATTVEGLFDSRHTLAQVAAGTPGRLDELLTPHGLDLLARPTGGLAAGLKATDDTCRTWRPEVPVRLYATEYDEQAVHANAIRCRADLERSGARARIVELGDVRLGGSPHFGSEPAALADLLTLPAAR